MKNKGGLPARLDSARLAGKAGKIVIIFIILASVFAGFFCIQAVFAQEKININTATLEELDTLPGIGVSKAQAIIDYREANGPFQAIEEITNVSGIGTATFENIKDLITVDGEQEEDLPIDVEESEEYEEKEAEPPIGGSASLGDIVINEFVSDPADGEVEWVELYNTTSQVIDLTGWSIEEGSGAKTSLEGKIGLNGADRFFIIEKPKGNLNNKGDIIILHDANDNLIDQVAYGEWDDGLSNNNAPVTGDPYSTARKFDGQNSYNNANDFAITITPTKGESNVILEEEEYESGIINYESGDYDYSNDIIISEAFPNPFGSDTESEFIELYNKGKKDINLLGWRLGDESKKRFEFKEKRIVKPEEYLVIYRSESKIALNNTSDSVKLFQPLKDEPLRVVKYEKAVEGWSFANARIATNLTQIATNDEWKWTEVVTPGEENIIKTINHPPVVDFSCPEQVQVGVPIIFDSSDTIDEDEDILEYYWDFGDGFTNSLPIPGHTFMKEGVYTVKLTVSDGENEVVKERIVKVSSPTPSPRVATGEAGSPSSAAFLAGEGSLLKTDIIINEFLPNPEGSDADGEWVEIKNKSNEQVNLLNWKLDDIEGGSKPYKFIDDVWLDAGMYYLVDRVDSRLALNNSNDAVRLYNNLDELMEEVEYEAAFEGESYARGENGKWFWTTVLTPGEENVISVSDSSLEINVLGAEFNEVQRYSKRVSEPIMTTLEKIREFDSGDLVIVKGTVAVLPGILGSQYFYIVGQSRRGEAEVDSSGIQVYSYKKDFPNLRVGDYIEVNGELSVVNGEMRLKTKQAADMVVIKNSEEPVAEEVSCDKVNEDYVGQLVKVTGEIVERKSSIIYLDDGLDEVLIYLKKTTGINPKSFNEGEIIEATGIVSRTRSGIRIMPRGKDDIIKKDIESQSGEEGRVLGEVARSDEWAIEMRDKKIELFKYLLVIALTIIIILAGLLTKEIIGGKNK